ncbi:MAG: hypothetical protein H7A18_01410 [Sinobacteraceae bacterium]|nr:hypothetical protein [Nevskiaceae bacterium]MCP5470725.1 hypothetical protein [Nevskiaceae bacterium]
MAIAVVVMSVCASVAASSQRESTTFYLSPSGRDSADGRSPEHPMRSFERAFSKLQAGDELVLLDGTYSAASGTGTIHWDNGSASAQIPSGTAQRPTVVRAQNPGSVRIIGPLFIGRSNRKDSYIRIQGLTFEGGGSLYNSSFVTLKDVGFHGPFDIGTNDHHQGNTDNLVEDVWIWSAGARVIAINYRAHRNVWRRVLVRGDGCGTSACSGSGNPNVGFTVYDSMDVSVQNVMVIDRVLAGSDSPYADFACAQHTSDPRYYFGRNEWLGVLSLNSPDIGFYCEPDEIIDQTPTLKLIDSVFWNARQGGVNIARAGQRHHIRNLRIRSSGDGFRFAPALKSSGASIGELIIDGDGRFAVNSSVAVSGAAISGRWNAPVNQAGCAERCSYSTIPDPRYELPGLALIGYGRDGTRHGEEGFDAPSGKPLWPWPNDARIRNEMCAATSRGFCAAGTTISSYVAGSDFRTESSSDDR